MSRTCESGERSRKRANRLIYCFYHLYWFVKFRRIWNPNLRLIWKALRLIWKVNLALEGVHLQMRGWENWPLLPPKLFLAPTTPTPYWMINSLSPLRKLQLFHFCQFPPPPNPSPKFNTTVNIEVNHYKMSTMVHAKRVHVFVILTVS